MEAFGLDGEPPVIRIHSKTINNFWHEDTIEDLAQIFNFVESHKLILLGDSIDTEFSIEFFIMLVKVL